MLLNAGFEERVDGGLKSRPTGLSMGGGGRDGMWRGDQNRGSCHDSLTRSG